MIRFLAYLLAALVLPGVAAAQGKIRIEKAADGTLTATARTTLKQTDYGIQPVSVAGVVNVITKKEIKGLHLDGSAGISQRGDADEQRASITYGFGDQNQTKLEGIDTTEGTGANAGYFDFGSFEEFQVGGAGSGAVFSPSPQFLSMPPSHSLAVSRTGSQILG